MTRLAAPVSRRAVLGLAAGAAALVTARSASAAPSARANVLFVSHGSPLYLPGNDARRAELHAWGKTLAKPRGIVVMTPHVASRQVTVGPTHRGFAMYDLPLGIKKSLPQDLEYATPPSDALATQIDALLASSGRAPAVRLERRGFDHTTWMPLLCLFPNADVPVIELGYPYIPEAEQFALGRLLAPLQDEGITFVGSAGMTHNLAMMGATEPAGVPSWASEFDVWASEQIAASDIDALIDWRRKAPAPNLAHPDDGAHFRVLLVTLGAALGTGRGAVTGRGPAAAGVTFPVTGFEASMSKRCVQLS